MEQSVETMDVEETNKTEKNSAKGGLTLNL